MSFILVPITPFAVFLLSAFVQWDFNPGNWGMDARFLTALGMAFGTLFATTFAAQLEAGR